MTDAPAGSGCDFISVAAKQELQHELLLVKSVVNGYYTSLKDYCRKVGLDKVLIPDTAEQQKGLAAALTYTSL